MGLEFKTAGWNASLEVGFLCDPIDHRVTLTAPGESMDLFLRLQTDPNTINDAESALRVLREKAKALRLLGARVLLRDDSGNGNRYTLLIAQENLQSVIGELNEERAQIAAIYNRLHGWLSCLFEDESLEKELSKLKPAGLSTAPSESALATDSPVIESQSSD